MRFNGQWAADYLRRMVIPDFHAFAEVVTKRVLPTFDTFGTEALKRGEEHFRAHAGNLDPQDDEQFEAASYVADEALDETFAYADMLVSMYFASIGLYSVGLSHLFEQHAADLALRLLETDSHDDEIKLRKVIEWLKTELSVDVEAFASWPTIKELRLVANTVKHAQGDSAVRLRLVRPDLFIHPSRREGGEAPEHNSRVRKPLFGEDLYLTPDDFSRYAQGAIDFWSELAEALAKATPIRWVKG